VVRDTYRSTAPVCPGCPGLLEPRALRDVEIDVCESCGGVWFDWFDGELTSLARRARVVGPRVTTPRDDGRVRDRACPRCLDPLQADTVHETEVLRCASCAGVFVSREATETLAHVHAPSEQEAARGDPLARLGAWLKDLFFGGAAS
jgi:Zn-finger nucleic acid-binding protein